MIFNWNPQRGCELAKRTTLTKRSRLFYCHERTNEKQIEPVKDITWPRLFWSGSYILYTNGWLPVFLTSLISLLSLTFTLWTGKVLHSACSSPVCHADAKHMQPLLVTHFHRFRFWMRIAWGSPDVLLCFLLYVLAASLLPLAQSASLLQQRPAFFSLSKSPSNVPVTDVV